MQRVLRMLLTALEAPNTDTGYNDGWARILNDDAPIIYISLGTVFNDKADFYRMCFEALADIDRQGVLSVGKRTNIAALGTIPGFFYCERICSSVRTITAYSVVRDAWWNEQCERGPVLWCSSRSHPTVRRSEPGWATH